MARDFKNVKKIVVKVGTNLLSGKNGIDRARIDSFTNQIAILREKGYCILDLLAQLSNPIHFLDTLLKAFKNV